MHVRSAEPKYAEALRELYRHLVPTDPNIHIDPRRVGELHADPHNHLLVAELGGAAIGTAFLSVCLDPMYGFQPFGVIENVIVLPAYARKGVGRALMAAAEAEARAANCTKLMLLSSLARSQAHQFFARIGYDGNKKRAFIKYLNRCEPLSSSAE